MTRTTLAKQVAAWTDEQLQRTWDNPVLTKAGLPTAKYVRLSGAVLDEMNARRDARYAAQLAAVAGDRAAINDLWIETGAPIFLDARDALDAAAKAAPQWQREFPDYPAADLPPIPAHWVDSSWRNEHCPRWDIGDSLLVFVDYPNAADREFPESPRFTVHRLIDGMFPEGDSVLFSSDEWGDVLANVLAFTFAENLRADLTDAEWSAMRLANVGIGEGVCASHDFRDANMNMAEAFEAVTGREPSIGFETHYDAETGQHVADNPDEERRANEDAALWSAAWGIATPRYLTAPVVDYAAPALTRTEDLGCGWYANAFDDGTIILRNSEKGQRIDLPADSVARLREIFVTVGAIKEA